MKLCAIAIRDDKDIPDETQENQIYVHLITFTEATTESVLQLSFSCIILREFGLSENSFSRGVQISSLVISILTISLEMAKVHNFSTLHYTS